MAMALGGGNDTNSGFSQHRVKTVGKKKAEKRELLRQKPACGTLPSRHTYIHTKYFGQ